MASHKFVEYSRIFRKHSIPLGLRPNTIISCHAVAHKVAEPLFAARSVDTMLNRRIRTPGYDGVKATDIRMIMRGTSSKDTTRNPLLPLSDDKGREELPVLPVPPFQDRPLRNFYDLVEGMQHALKKGKYEADVLMPRGWDLRWYRRQYDQLQKEKTRDSKDNNNTSSNEMLDDNGNELIMNNNQPQQQQLPTTTTTTTTTSNTATSTTKLHDIDHHSVPGYGVFTAGKNPNSYEERPYLGASTMYDRCMDQYCFDLLMASLPLDYLYEAGNHSLPLRSIRTAHMAIAKHVEGMQSDLRVGQSFTSAANGGTAKPTPVMPVLLEIAMLRLKDHIPRDKMMTLLTEATTAYYKNATTRNLLSVIASLVHRRVHGDIRTRSLGLAPNNALTELLCNMYLYPLDAFLVSRGYRLVRYLDRIILVLPDVESAIRISRDIVFFAEGELEVPASLNRTQLLPPGEEGTLLLCDVHVDSTTGRYHYYIPHSHATMLEDLIRKLHKLLLDTPHGDSGNDNKMMISQEAGYCARQILGRANLYLNIDSTIPCVSRISKLYSKGSLTKEGIINEVRSWNEVPDQL